VQQRPHPGLHLKRRPPSFRNHAGSSGSGSGSGAASAACCEVFSLLLFPAVVPAATL
jgi:hypothetical protein